MFIVLVLLALVVLLLAGRIVLSTGPPLGSYAYHFVRGSPFASKGSVVAQRVLSLTGLIIATVFSAAICLWALVTGNYLSVIVAIGSVAVVVFIVRISPTFGLRRFTSHSSDSRRKALFDGRLSVITRSLAVATGVVFFALAALAFGTGIALAGDGGLADGSGSSWTWTLLAGLGIAFALAGLATVKVARR